MLRFSLALSLALSACSSSSPKEDNVAGSADTHQNNSDAEWTTPAQDTTGSEPQSFSDGITALCNSINDVPADIDPAQRQLAVANRIRSNVTNPEVRKLFELVGNMPAKHRPDMLKAAATKAGVTVCALAEE